MGQLLGTAVDRDTLLTIASIYWFTNAGASSARIYYEDRHGPQPAGPTTTPIGLASFANDFQPIRRFVERDHTRLVSWNSYDRGGHWSAHDAPDLLYRDIRRFFRGLVVDTPDPQHNPRKEHDSMTENLSTGWAVLDT